MAQVTAFSQLFCHRPTPQRQVQDRVAFGKQLCNPILRPSPVSTSLLVNSTRAPPSSRAGSLRVYAAAAPETSTVKIIIQGRNISVTPSIKEYVESKVSHAVSSFENVVKEVDVKLRVHGGDYGKGPREQITEITVYTFRNGVVRVEDRESSLYSSIDVVSDKLSRKLRKVKEIALRKGKWPGHRANVKGGKGISELLAEEQVLEREVPEVPAPAMVEPLPAEVVRSKSFVLEPMSLDDALDQLQNVGHDFYVFLNKESNQVQVLYKRRSEGYGVIIPTPAISA